MTQQPNPAVRIVALLLVAGGAFGAWKWLGRSHGGAAPAGGGTTCASEAVEAPA